MKKFLIYGLVDPETDQIRYIGKSSNGLERPKSHFEPANTRKKRHIYNWIRGLAQRGLKPEILVLEEFEDASMLYEVEHWFISYFRFIGCNLTNLSDGGPGCSGPKSETTKAKISAALKGRIVGSPSAEHREKLRASNLGQTRSNETRLKMSKSKGGRPFVDQNGTIFESIQEAGRILDIPATEICAVLKGKRRHTRGFSFTYLESNSQRDSAGLFGPGDGCVKKS